MSKTTLFFILLTLSGGFFVSEIFKRFLKIKLGRPENRNDYSRKRWKYLYTQIILHKKIRKFPLFGFMHGFIMWGFLVLLFSSFDMGMIGLFNARIPFLGDNAGYLMIRDIFIVLVLVGVSGSFMRRVFKRPDWMHNSLMSYSILALILVIVISELLFFALEISLGVGYRSGAWLVIVASKLFVNLNISVAHTLMGLFWWVHFLAIFTFLIIIPRSKHLHLVFAPFNTYWHSLKPKGALMPVQLNGEKGHIYGVSKPEDFTWKQLLDAFSCVKCGRCHGSCPAFQTGERLKLKKLNGRLRTHMEQLNLRKEITPSENKPSKRKLVAGILEEEALWSCTTCGACEEACPVSCEHLSKIIDLRRYIASSVENISPEVNQVFSRIESYGNPWGGKRSRVTVFSLTKELNIPTFAEGPDSEYLFFLGCAPFYDEAAQKATIAFTKILKKARIDFAILGEEEVCCGETVRRLGNEYLFQTIASRNISNWNANGIKKIITTCPHCFNTLQNEYSQLGGNYEVIPHLVFLKDLLQKGMLKPENHQNISVTFHDSCYLGRYNGFYDEPREILKSIPGVSFVEMSRTREDSFCCGAGGGLFWLREKSNQEISRNRADEAFATGAEAISTACPYCRIVLQEQIGTENPGKEIKTLDIAEILESSL